jgi:hypothetical protein
VGACRAGAFRAIAPLFKSRREEQKGALVVSGNATLAAAARSKASRAPHPPSRAGEPSWFSSFVSVDFFVLDRTRLSVREEVRDWNYESEENRQSASRSAEPRAARLVDGVIVPPDEMQVSPVSFFDFVFFLPCSLPRSPGLELARI